MNVLIVSFYYTPELGAAPSRITNMAEGLKRKGGNVEILTCLPNYPKGHIFDGYKKRLYKKEMINGIPVYRYWTYATVSKNSFARILGMLFFSISIWLFGLKFWKVCQYDRVIIQSPPLMVSFSAILLFRLIYRRKTIINISDLWPLSAIELGAVKENSFYCKVLQWMERVIYKHTYAYQGQSMEIINHVKGYESNKKHFLYRNLQPQLVSNNVCETNRQVFKIVYAGLLGIAQNILGIIQQINFKEVGAELHIYGGGNQANEIQQYAERNDCGIVFHGYQTKETINAVLGQYHASIVPLTVRIKGAVPSKIFDLLPHGTPILYAGGGEGEQIISDYSLGFTSAPGDYEALKQNIIKMRNLSDENYNQLRENCLEASKNAFSFEKQMNRYFEFLELS